MRHHAPGRVSGKCDRRAQTHARTHVPRAASPLCRRPTCWAAAQFNVCACMGPPAHLCERIAFRGFGRVPWPRCHVGVSRGAAPSATMTGAARQVQRRHAPVRGGWGLRRRAESGAARDAEHAGTPTRPWRLRAPCAKSCTRMSRANMHVGTGEAQRHKRKATRVRGSVRHCAMLLRSHHSAASLSLAAADATATRARVMAKRSIVDRVFLNGAQQAAQHVQHLGQIDRQHAPDQDMRTTRAVDRRRHEDEQRSEAVRRWGLHACTVHDARTASLSCT